MCAKCGKPVTAASAIRDELRQAWIYKGWCHGTFDRIVVTDRELMDSPGRAIVFFEQEGAGQ